MGNSVDKELKHNERIHHHFHQVEPSPFYCACRNGDLETVRLMLRTISYKDLNRLELYDNTPLHAASFYGHKEIVRLLLHERNCDRSQRNRYGLTAYEVAKNDEIRQLFHRPLNINRFCDNNTQNNNNNNNNSNQQTFSIVSSPLEQVTKDNDNDHEPIPSKWVKLYQTDDEIYKEIHYLSKGKRLLRSKFGRYIAGKGAKYQGDQKLNDYENLMGYLTNRLYRVNEIRKIIDNVVSKEHDQYDRCCNLLLKYSRDGDVESLLRLYSLETPFYHALRNNIAPLKWPLFLNLSDLKHRYFQGQCYRGILMTNDDLRSYHWAFNNKGSYIRTNTFSSTSTDRKIAESFHEISLLSTDRISVLMHYHFPKPCDQAIYLGSINKSHLPCISEYENESEVLILPRTLFIIENIYDVTIIDEEQQQKQYTVIYLENVLHAKESLLSSLKFLISKTEQNEMALYYNSIAQAEQGNISNETIDI
ncbi:unnamed protein product [Rotaria sp. Silwood1]|nr:unnamed protein product [Rotaria sp. Silwood1]CAF3664098.1 unnamed protein product [Rotaria sp. Silwood1]CAF3707284.1 unnamed protein product [Rotaria sp. Silwood1]CAF4899596.1 unnamed protein product [Rotaria sp. Silwood1]CAF5004000.1 unnamed protein product [Rotaria sp. Silwood1]